VGLVNVERLNMRRGPGTCFKDIISPWARGQRAILRFDTARMTKG
jgi:hypothetical protein